jgi:ribonuclease HII|tara:strand:+ start:561 stop:1256 length:696 start_codon:yes stop_codon:yes gene_type:complete
MSDFNLERENFNNNSIMIGVDEVGRGSWAGPIVAASSWINFQNYKLLPKDINDSKKISSKTRKKIILSLNNSVKYSSAISTPEEIDRYGLTVANTIAMKRSLYCLFQSFNENTIKKKLNFKVYVDGNYMPDFSSIDITLKKNKIIKLDTHDLYSLVKGDEKSKTIALASIIAKETRDSIMRNYSLKYSQYKFDKHFGYGTAKHREAILEFGITPIHRKSFKPISTIYSALQ